MATEKELNNRLLKAMNAVAFPEEGEEVSELEKEYLDSVEALKSHYFSQISEEYQKQVTDGSARFAQLEDLDHVINELHTLKQASEERIQKALTTAINAMDLREGDINTVHAFFELLPEDSKPFVVSALYLTLVGTSMDFQDAEEIPDGLIPESETLN